MKNVNWKSILILIVAIPLVYYAAERFGQAAAERTSVKDATSRAQPAQSKQIRLVVSTQDAGGVTQDQLDLAFLKNLETYIVERVKIKSKAYLESIGQPNISVDISSEAIYVYAGKIKLAVVRLKSVGARQVHIAGIVGRELRRVGCLRSSEEDIPISYGTCGEKIKEIFGATVGG